MKIDFISDLHMDFWIKERDISKPKFKKELEDFINEVLVPKDGEVLIIAGDLSHYNNQTKALLIELKKIYKNIILTFGNHDLYLLSNSQIYKYKSMSENRLLDLKDICNELDVYYLDGNIIEINDVRFGGTGSWYNLPTQQDIDLWEKVMNDSKKIYNGYTVQSYGMYQSYSQPSTNWNTQKFYLKEKAKLIEVANQKCNVFITHVALNEPTEDEGMHDEYIGDPDNIFYYTSNFDILKKSGCSIAIHGHTHQSLDYKKEGIRILCNPLGYKSENTYVQIKQIDIKG